MTIRMTEDSFLEQRIGDAVAIYLINGIKLLGILQGHDTEVVFLMPHDVDDFLSQMISKAAISTIVSTPKPQTNHPSTDPLAGILNRRD